MTRWAVPSGGVPEAGRGPPPRACAHAGGGQAKGKRGSLECVDGVGGQERARENETRGGDSARCCDALRPCALRY